MELFLVVKFTLSENSTYPGSLQQGYCVNHKFDTYKSQQKKFHSHFDMMGF